MKAWGRLLRLSLAPTAAADIAAGIVFGSRGEWIGGASPWLLIGASLAIYHGNLAVNDWADRAHDGLTRPGRPIPSRAISPGAALALGLSLVALGAALAFCARFEVGLWMCAVALIALTYNLIGRGAWTGPLLLATCRAGNLGAGLALALWAAANRIDATAAAVLCSLYFAYVFCLSRLGRMEDAEDAAPLGRRPSVLLSACALVLIAVPLTPRWPESGAARALAFALTGLAAIGLARTAWTTRHWSRAAIESAMGMALRRLLVFTAAVALLALRPNVVAPIAVALAVLAGYPFSRGLRRIFPPS